MTETTSLAPPPVHITIQTPPIPLAMALSDAARFCGVSADTLSRAAAKGDLVTRYPSSRPVIETRELERWLHSRPTESPAAGRRR